MTDPYEDAPRRDLDEPDEWETGPQLWTQPLITTVLCRYTGFPYPLEEDPVCLERANQQHPDEDCWEHFYSAAGIRDGLVLNAAEELAHAPALREIRYGPGGATGIPL